MQPTVEDLFEQWRSRGDSRALATLFDRTAPEVWRVARHLCGNRSEADDLLQTTFLAVMEGAARFRTGEALVPWMLGILTNKLRMARRRQRLAAELEAGRPEGEVDPRAAAEAAETRDLLRARLANLPETYRAVLVLQFEHGFSAPEVAHTLGRPLATVRSQAYRGLELLRQSLPAGFVAQADGEPEPNLRSARAAVLFAAGGHAAVGGISLGAILMTKKLLLGALALLLVAVWYAWPRPDAPAEQHAVVAATPAPAPAATPVVPALEAPSAGLRTEVAAAAPAAGTLRVRVVWHDGSVAAAMGVCVQPAVEGADWFARRWQTTDGGGVAVFERLAPGSVRVHARHGGSLDATVAAAGASDALLTIPKGLDARGTVVDPGGAPVAGASIVVGRRPDEMFEAARTDANGSFFLRSIETRALVAAFAEGFQHSRTIGAGEFATQAQQLQLAPAGGSVAGRVVDPDGRPIAGAWVAQGYGVRDGPPIVAMGMALTDAAGGFRVSGLPAKMRWPLHAGAADYAAWRGNVRVEVGKTAVVEIVLDRAVVLRGVVRGAAGAPARGIVEAFDANAPGKKLEDPRPPWSRALATAGTDGT